ncbi:MAG: hypothetical protein WCT05_05400 [Lentisphaeria bacterium]
MKPQIKVEQNYEFRRELNQVHKANRRQAGAVLQPDEVMVDESWNIVVGSNPHPVLLAAARDLQDYFLVSMNLHLSLCQKADSSPAILLTVKEDVGQKRSYHFEVTEKQISICGTDPAGTGQGCYYLEDLMNLREAPFVTKDRFFRKPLFSPRMVHSGWGLDQFPDAHLNAIAHAGFDSVLLFVKGPHQTTHGVMDFNDLIDRCEHFGLGVYFYSYLPSFKSPDDPDAGTFFDSSFGEVFKQSPKAKGIILVGESCCFPSKDPNTTGREGDYSNTKNEGIADPRITPGFWPCNDYPQWLNAVKKSIRKHAPKAEIVFWTYNWGKIDEKYRLELIRNLPKDIILQATFEMFEVINKYPNHQMVQPDYSITFPGPGQYFSSEAQCAKECGLRLYTMSNTAGRTWDFGVAPYVPTPQQWFKRFRAMREAQKNWGLSGVMDSHHYGWYPSPISECAKWSFWSPEVDLEQLLYRIAVRDFGEKAASEAVAAWQLWSDAINSYTPGFDDQAGPLRVGPSYPLIFHPILYPHTEQKMQFPTTPLSPVGARWLHPMYNPEHIYGQTNCGRRIHEDIKIMSAALQTYDQGTALMTRALTKVPDEKRITAAKLAGVGEFCGNSIRTMIHVKRWWILNKRLEIEYDFSVANAILDEMVDIVNAEMTNVEATIPLVQADSLLGWEASMDYMCDAKHLQWKIRQLNNLLNTLQIYRKSLCRHPNMTR